MSKLIDKILWLLKWPIAIVSILLLPSSAKALLALAIECLKSPVLMGAFCGGVFLYMIVWFAIIKRTRASLILTIEHELTHCIFAWLTLHRVTDFKATWSEGGHMNYDREQDNWLVTIAPYFFPTAPLILLLCFWFFSDAGSMMLNFLLGISFTYHLTSTRRETGGHQTDLQKVGFPFAFMFLPTANIVFSGIVIAFACGRSEAVTAFFSSLVPV
jgi:hypothetical protein